MTTPPTTSLWPPMYFVVECTTRSAPSASGCCKKGEAKVLSTASSTPDGRDRASSAMSQRRRSGLLGVSSQSRRVLARASRPGLPHVARIDEGNVDAVAREYGRKKPVRAAVDVPRGEDVVAAAQQRERAPNRRHARREGRGEGSALERGELAFHRAARRVDRARVVEAFRHADLRERKRRRLIDGDDRSAGRGTGILSAPDRARRETMVQHEMLPTAAGDGRAMRGFKSAADRSTRPETRRARDRNAARDRCVETARARSVRPPRVRPWRGKASRR